MCPETLCFPYHGRCFLFHYIAILHDVMPNDAKGHLLRNHQLLQRVNFKTAVIQQNVWRIF